MMFYRYICSPGAVDVHFLLKTYSLIRETKGGYWIGQYKIPEKWIPKESLKRFAYPTKEEALKNYILRSEKRVRILKSQITTTKLGILKAKNIKL